MCGWDCEENMWGYPCLSLWEHPTLPSAGIVNCVCVSVTDLFSIYIFSIAPSSHILWSPSGYSPCKWCSAPHLWVSTPHMAHNAIGFVNLSPSFVLDCVHLIVCVIPEHVVHYSWLLWDGRWECAKWMWKVNVKSVCVSGLRCVRGFMVSGREWWCCRWQEVRRGVWLH